MAKTQTISTRVSPDIKMLLSKQCEIKGLTQSSYIETLLMNDMNPTKDVNTISVPKNHNNALMGIGGAVVGVLSYKVLKSYLDDGTRTDRMIEALSIAGSIAVATLSVILLRRVSK
jgi:capsular polysaccharide biosynthesis protein